MDYSVDLLSFLIAESKSGCLPNESGPVHERVLFSPISRTLEIWLGLGPLMRRGRVNPRSVFVISSLAFIASAGAYTLERRRSSHQHQFELPPAKNKNPGKMAVTTPFHVSRVGLIPSRSSLGRSLARCLTQPPLLFHTPFCACLAVLGVGQQEGFGNSGLMKPETDTLCSAHDLRQLRQGHHWRPEQIAGYHQSRCERSGPVGSDRGDRFVRLVLPHLQSIVWYRSGLKLTLKRGSGAIGHR